MTKLKGVESWVAEVTKLCQPDKIHWCDGSEAENKAICNLLIQNGTFTRLNEELRPNSFLARSHPSDVARIEDRTFICASSKEKAGPTNNWADPEETRATLGAVFAGSMRGRTMYVLPFAMGSLDSPLCRIGVQITDSPYVVANMRIMTLMGEPVVEKLREGSQFIPCLHSVGAPLTSGRSDPPWPCEVDPAKRYIVHFPDEPAIWSYGSGYGGNALPCQKSFPLPLATGVPGEVRSGAQAMLALFLSFPRRTKKYIGAAFPSASGQARQGHV